MIKLNNFDDNELLEKIDKFKTYMIKPDLFNLEYDEYVFCDEHGFITFKIMDDILYISKCYGDGKCFRDLVFKAISKQSNKIKEIRTRCRRNPKAYERLFKCECYHTEMVDGKPLYYFKKKVR